MTVQTATFHYVTYIRSTPVRVFEAITRHDMARAYWGHENISDWTPGARWQHVRANAERTVELVGEVVEHAQPHRLVDDVVRRAHACRIHRPHRISPPPFTTAR